MSNETVIAIEGSGEASDNRKNCLSFPTQKEMKIYTKEEVAKHNSEESCWLIADGIVYDVTDWLLHHPAGVKSIVRHAGQDCTEDFHFHSKQAIQYWKKYQIGYIEGHSSCMIL